MKNVTFFSSSERIENFSHYMDTNPQVFNILNYVKNFFDENNITYQTYNYNAYQHGYKKLDYVFYSQAEYLGTLVGKLTNKFYPSDVVKKLSNKFTMSSFLYENGFNQLENKLINCVDDIGNFQNFIIKPICGSGGKSQFTESRIKFNLDDLSKIEYKKFKDINHLLSLIDDNKLNSMLLAGRFFIQNAYMYDDIDRVTFNGTIDENSNILFGRTIMRKYYAPLKSNCIMYFDAEIDEENLIRNFIKKNSIRNSAFFLQYIRIDNKLFPMDWNIRFFGKALRFAEFKNKPLETHQLLCNLYDIPFTPEYDTKKWITKEEYDVNLRHWNIIDNHVK